MFLAVHVPAQAINSSLNGLTKTQLSPNQPFEACLPGVVMLLALSKALGTILYIYLLHMKMPPWVGRKADLALESRPRKKETFIPYHY